MTLQLLNPRALRDDSKRKQQSDIQFKKSLDSILEILNRLDETTSSLSDEFLKLTNGEDLKARTVRRELVEVLWSPEWTTRPAGGNSMEKCISLSQHEDFKRTVIKSVKFEAIKRREEAIPQAYERSFEWVFDANADRENTATRWSNFTEWLEAADSKLYWITGKPGSGKSTLMKFILNHPNLNPLLRQWAGEFPLYVVSFYFWSAGSDYLQKTSEGFMRAILYQVLSQNPELVARVAPRRQAMFNILRDPHVAVPCWSFEELRESLQIMLSACQVRVALWVDGLDELEGTPTQVIELLRSIGAHRCVKICAASREWPEFEDEFGSNPLLRIHELTRGDIEAFTMGKFESSQGFCQLRAIVPEEAAKLAYDVIDKAQGVFIWVSLVVRSLLNDLTDGAKLSDLQSTLDGLPEDISCLYDTIWTKLLLNSRNIRNSSEIFQMVSASIGSLHFQTLWLADEKKSIEFNFKSIPNSSKEGIAKIIKRRLNSRTRGIIEISPDGHVDFLHRTARDWAFQPETWENICSAGQSPIHFSPDLALLGATIILMQDVSNFPGKSMGAFWEMMVKCLLYAGRISDSETLALELISMLNKLDETGTMISKEMDFLRTWWTNNKKRIRCTPHWSAAVSQDCQENNSFTGLMASFGVVSYVKKQAETDPNNVVSVSPGTKSVLHNAVHGFKVDKNEIARPFIARYGTIESRLAGRVKIVRFLLEMGVRPRHIHFKDLWDFANGAKTKGVDCDTLIEVLKTRESVKGVVSSAIQRLKHKLWN